MSNPRMTMNADTSGGLEQSSPAMEARFFHKLCMAGRMSREAVVALIQVTPADHAVLATLGDLHLAEVSVRFRAAVLTEFLKLSRNGEHAAARSGSQSSPGRLTA